MKQTHSISKIPQFSTLTREQFGGVRSSAKTVKVKARAGSGKTKLAMGYAAGRPKARGLYLAFGKPTQMQANARLKSLAVNTEARTTHSLAWSGFGSALDAACKLSSNGSMRTGVTAKLLNVNYGVAKAVNETVHAYLCSADKVLSDKHLPDDRDFPAVRFAAGAVMDNAKLMWARMTDLNDSDAKAIPDVYLKQWVNTDPKLPYEFILFDECQDANPLSAHLVSRQEHASRVYIGDEHQAIYGFRGAVNLMDELEAEETHTLSASFRFSKNIGILASTFLQHWKKEPVPLVGLGPGGRVLPGDQQAYLARTVAGLIGKGFELHMKGQKLHWIKGFEDYRIAPILEAYRLYKGESSSNFQDPVLKLMKSWAELADYVEVTRDPEAGPVYRLVAQYGDEIPNIVETLKREQIPTERDAPIVLTTDHKSKGLEWPVVRLINDHFSFKDPKESDKWLSPSKIDPQEANLMYVALTRAMKAIAPTTEIVEWFRQQPATAHLFPEPKAPNAPAPSEAESGNLPRAA